MFQSERSLPRRLGTIISLFVLLAISSMPVVAGEYDNALKDVKGVKVVFDVGLGEPKVANAVFWAVRNSYEDKTVQGLPEKPRMAMVFHGPAVKLLAKDTSGFPEGARGEIAKFQEMIRQLKKDGVKLEVCLYAAKVMGVDPTTIMPEIDQVGNGFISVIGYQAQGYSVIVIP